MVHAQSGTAVTLPRGVWHNGYCDCDSGYSGTMCSVERAPWWKFWRWFSTRDYVLAGGSLIVAVLLCMACYCCNCCCCCQHTSRVRGAAAMPPRSLCRLISHACPTFMLDDQRATGNADAKTRLMPRSGDGLESVKRTNSRWYDAIPPSSDGKRRNPLMSEDIHGNTSFHGSGGRDTASLASPPLSSSGGMVRSGTGTVDAAADDSYDRHIRLPVEVSHACSRLSRCPASRRAILARQNIGESVRVAYLSPPSGSRRTASRPYTRIRVRALRCGAGQLGLTSVQLLPTATRGYPPACSAHRHSLRLATWQWQGWAW